MFHCTTLRIKKALGIFRELITTRRRTTRVAFWDPPSMRLIFRGIYLALPKIILHRDADAVLCQRCDGVVANTIDDGWQQEFPDRQQASRLSRGETDETRRTFHEAVKHSGPLTRDLRLLQT